MIGRMSAGRAPIWLKDRLPAALALAIPTLAGVLYQAVWGAPLAFIAINGGSLVAGLLLIGFARIPERKRSQDALAAALTALLVAPLIFGPSIDGIARWISVGGISLHVGMIAAPLLVRLAASELRFGPWILLAGLLASYAQPDLATCLALTLGAFAAAISHRSVAMLAVSGLGGVASYGASLAAELPPQPFVEQVLPTAYDLSPVWAFVLGGSLLAAALVLLTQARSHLRERLAVVATMCGFLAAALIGNYPYPLIGYGAASIMGFSFALLPKRSDDKLKD